MDRYRWQVTEIKRLRRLLGYMRGTDWQEVNRKITEFYNAIKECEFFFVRSGKETEYAEISKYGRLEKGYDTG